MRHLKQYNESISPTYLKLIEYFISKILEYKSDKITNIKLINSEWEVRFGYADRKSISITTASHRLKDDNIIICAQFYSQHIIIDLHAMDENGKKI